MDIWVYRKEIQDCQEIFYPEEKLTYSIFRYFPVFPFLVLKFNTFYVVLYSIVKLQTETSRWKKFLKYLCYEIFDILNVFEYFFSIRCIVFNKIYVRQEEQEKKSKGRHCLMLFGVWRASHRFPIVCSSFTLLEQGRWLRGPNVLIC